MGYTQHSVDLVERHLIGVKSVLDFGQQNDYSTGAQYPPFISEWYESKNISYKCIDLAPGNNALQLDWARPLLLDEKFSLIGDMGSSEHSSLMEDYTTVAYNDGHINSIYPKGEHNIEVGYYNCWLNKFTLCEIGGLIISENPKHLSWPYHGFTYLTEDFYIKLARIAPFEIIELGEHAACGNFVDGWNIYSVLKKTGNNFCTFDEFKTLDFRTS